MLAACGGSNSPAPTPFLPAGLPSPTHGGQVIYIAAEGNVFDRDELSAESNEDISLIFVNNDATPHNVAIYNNENAEEEVFVGETFTGPGEVRDYFFTTPEEGTYFFRCDVHPTTMTGEFKSN
jgi:plastocyanin